MESADTSRGSGSSPRVRGTLRRRRAQFDSRRFIPACAGNSSSRHQIAVIATGSSPRVRGTRRPRRCRAWRWRTATPVHPRVCGELTLNAAPPIARHGSSPRVRGTRLPFGLQLTRTRFIPACAGNSSLPPTRTTRETVHPRVCGELNAVKATPSAAIGSSPRVRGTRELAKCNSALARFIPACAGNSDT